MTDDRRSAGPDIHDISRLAGVSPATVSKILGPHADAYRISPATRERVIAAAKELGYVPNRIKSFQATRKSHVIGLLYAERFPLAHAVYEEISGDLAAILAEHGFKLAFYPVETWSDIAKTAARFPMDGCILAPPLPTGPIPPGAASGLPLVILNAASDYPAPQIRTDDAQGMRTLLGHLLTLGHHRIWYADLPRTDRHYSETLRLDAYRAVLQEAGLPEFICIGTAAEVLAKVRSHHGTALVTYNNQLATKLIPELRQTGVAIPTDLSVATATDDKIAKLVDPAWTCLAIPMPQMVRQACAELVAIIQGLEEQALRVLTFPQRLIIRDSTGKPPLAAT